MAEKKLKTSDISVDKVFPSGAYRLSHFQDGVLESRQYMGYSKKDAIKMHKETFSKKGN